MTIRKLAILMALAVATIGPLSCNKESGPVSEAVSNKGIYWDAYIYGFSIVMNYGVMYEYFVECCRMRPASSSPFFLSHTSKPSDFWPG